MLLSLPLLIVMFNSSATHNKSKVYSEKDASESINPAIIHQFGASRFSNDQHKTIRTESELTDLYEMDWSNYTLKTVVIDPGHGGKDEGTIAADGTQEKDIALSISKKLGDFIKASYPEVKVIYTRTTDKFIPLRKRAEIANTNKADLFISIHCNSFSKSSVRGTETYVMGLHRAGENMDVIKRENDVVLLEEDYETEYEEYGVDKSSPLYDILMNSYQNAYLEQSLSFAATVENKLKSKGKSTRGVHQAGFLVLRRTAMPSVLVETGYLSNPSDKAILTSPKGQNELASSLYYAFAEYKNALDDKRTGKVELTQEKPITKPISFAEKSEDSSPKPIYNKPKSSNSGVEFGIQLASVDKELDLDESKWSKFKNRLTIEKSRDGLIRYLLKDYGIDYEKAKREKKRLREAGFNGCFIVAYKKDKRIELYKAKKELGL